MALGADDGFLSRLIERSDLVLIKKLSNNDRLWARQKLDDDGNPVPGKRMNNQAGVYIPHKQRDGGFFSYLGTKGKNRRKARRDLGAIYRYNLAPGERCLRHSGR